MCKKKVFFFFDILCFRSANVLHWIITYAKCHVYLLISMISIYTISNEWTCILNPFHVKIENLSIGTLLCHTSVSMVPFPNFSDWKQKQIPYLSFQAFSYSLSLLCIHFQAGWFSPPTLYRDEENSGSWGRNLRMISSSSARLEDKSLPRCPVATEIWPVLVPRS